MGYGNTEVFLSNEEREALIHKYLGKTVEIIVDRPIGHVHVTKGVTLHYTVNYGFIPGVMGGDGEEQDVYILGVSEPVERFIGRIIGVIRRKDDNEDKFVAAPVGMEFHQAEIMEAVHFVEKYFDSAVEPLFYKSCGVIPYRFDNGTPQYLLCKETASGGWSFPKGRMEAFETEEETALREFREETGMLASLEPVFRATQEYSLSNDSWKQVILFLGRCTGQLIPNRNEILEYRWVTAAEAKQLLFANTADVIDQAERFLREERKI